MEFVDYSSRRGAIVPLFPGVHNLLKELATKDKAGAPPMPETLVIWRRKMNELLMDTERRFLFALEKKGDKRDVLGYIIYRCEARAPKVIYIEDMQIARERRRDPAVVEGLINKFQLDLRTRDAQFFGGEKLKMVPDKEILAEVGFRDSFPDGWEPMGNCKEAMGSLRVRYIRAKD
jgi:hypothetical protein